MGQELTTELRSQADQIQTQIKQIKEETKDSLMQ
jgi:hypothetical protein